MENILNWLEPVWRVIVTIGSVIWSFLSGIIIGLWNNPSIIIFVAIMATPVIIAKKNFNRR